MKKRWIALMLVLLMAWPVCTGMAAAGYRTLLEREGFYCFAVDGNDVWFEQGKELWLSKGGTDPRLIGEYGFITALTARGGMGYVSYMKDDEAYVAQISRDGERMQEWLVPADFVQSMCAAEGTLALITGNVETELMLLDTKTGAIQVAEDVLNPLALCTGADGKSIIACSILSNMFWRIDPAAMQIQEIGTPDAFPNAVYETEEGVLRILQNQAGFVKIYEYTPGGETSEIGEIPMGESSIFGMELSAEHIFVQADGKLMRYTLKDFEKQAPERTLNICLDIGAEGDMRFTQAIRLFQEKYPDVKVKQERVGREDLVLSLMSGEKTCDVFLMDPQATDPLERAGLFADMSVYPQITQALENWLEMDGLLYDSQGRLIRVPTSIEMSSCWAVPYVHHYDLLIESGLEIPMEPMDYAQFRSLCQQAREKGIYLYSTETRLSEVEALYTALYADPMNGVLNYDTPEFREMMEYWKSLKDEDLVLFFDSQDNGYENRKNNETYLYSIDLGERGISYHRDPAVRKWIYPPTPDGTPIAPARVEALYLYAYGAQMDLAADFIATFASVEAQAAEYDCYNLFLKDLTLYNNYETWTTPYLTSYPARWPEIGTVEEMDVYPEEFEQNAELYACAAPVRFMDEVRLPFYRFTEQYMNGEISLDELIAALNEKADIWLNE